MASVVTWIHQSSGNNLAQCHRPGQQHRQSATQAEYSVEPDSGSPVKTDQKFCRKSQSESADKSEQMCAKIGAFSGASQQGQQRQRCRNREYPALPMIVAVAEQADGGDQPDRAEDGGRCADSTVVEWLEQGVAQITQKTTDQQQTPAQPGAQITAEPHDKQTAEAQVAEQVDQIGMQGEGGQQAPPLAVEDLAGVSIAEFKPVDGPMAEQVDVELSQVMEAGEQEQDRKTG